MNFLSEVSLEIEATCPLMLCSAPGHDVSGHIDAMAQSMNKEISSVSMGCSEWYGLAERMVSTDSTIGTWVLLHLK